MDVVFGRVLILFKFNYGVIMRICTFVEEGQGKNLKLWKTCVDAVYPNAEVVIGQSSSYQGMLDFFKGNLAQGEFLYLPVETVVLCELQAGVGHWIRNENDFEFSDVPVRVSSEEIFKADHSVDKVNQLQFDGVLKFGEEPVDLIWWKEGDEKFQELILRKLSDDHFLKIAEVDCDLVLYVGLYDPKNEERFDEIAFCLEQNLHHPAIKEVVIFAEDGVSKVEHEKISAWIDCDVEMLYSDVFAHAAEHHRGEKCVVMNNDIFLDHGSFLKLDEIDNLLKRDCVLSLSRHEFDPEKGASVMDENFANLLFAHTQDAWLFEGGLEPQNCEFRIGILGCDNAINDRFLKAGKIPMNLGTSYRVHHFDVCRGKTSENFLSGEYRASSRESYPEEQGQFLTPDFNIVMKMTLDDLKNALKMNDIEVYHVMCQMMSQKIKIKNR